MTGQRVRKRGATWVHERRAEDTPNGFVHTVCGLAFTTAMANLHDEAWIEVDCPTCVQTGAMQARADMLAATPVHEFRPKTGEIAVAWSGPRVEVVNDRDPDGDVTTTVFVDGVEVPEPHLHVHTVDPGAGWTYDDWQRATQDVTSDVTLTEAFRETVVQMRDETLALDRGYIEDVP
jgi:hypothetical protein